MLSALLLAAGLLSGSASAQVFPPHFCDALPNVSPKLFEAIKARSPEMAEAGVIKQVPLDMALATVKKGVAMGLGSIDLFTDDAFRGDCVFFMSRSVMVGVEDHYALDLIAPVYHNDEDGKRFEMAGLVAGRGKIYIFYDHDDIRFENEGADGRKFHLRHTVRMETPKRETLGPIDGIYVRVFLFGDLPIRSIARDHDDHLKIKAGDFDSDAHWTPIRAKAPAEDATASAYELPSFLPTEDLRPAASPSLNALLSWPQ